MFSNGIHSLGLSPFITSFISKVGSTKQGDGQPCKKKEKRKEERHLNYVAVDSYRTVPERDEYQNKQSPHHPGNDSVSDASHYFTPSEVTIIQVHEKMKPSMSIYVKEQPFIQEPFTN
ncbi:hypothetical protein RUM44_013016 [Polyplax serrata]|uniref:Uncharacterized protein n=1 Tax=Polyplax serrata TaxID=468196 RepID=A0ABR1BH48_POLSC